VKELTFQCRLLLHFNKIVDFEIKQNILDTYETAFKMAPKKAAIKKNHVSEHKSDGKADHKKSEGKKEVQNELEAIVDENISEVVAAPKAKIDENLLSVQFLPPTITEQVSIYKGSILAQDEPYIPLSDAEKERITNSFKDFVSLQIQESIALKQQPPPDNFIPLAKLFEYLVFHGYDFPKPELERVLKKYLDPTVSEYNLSTIFNLIEKFHAPNYYFGQRLRLNCSRGNISGVVDLLVRGCHPSTSDGNGLSGIHYAAQFNKPEVLQSMAKLLANSKNYSLNINAVDKEGWTALHCAAQHGSKESIKMLIELGANPSAQNSMGKTPLHLAAGQANVLCCEILVQGGASVNAQDNHGMTPIHAASFNGHDRAFNIISKLSGVDNSIKDLLGNTATYYLRSGSSNSPPDEK